LSSELMSTLTKLVLCCTAAKLEMGI
jgi:hypothetical protein